ncbi:MAG: hypothetical protein N2746_03870 [Deltaproteobacteria bacterium]|nr:hypothetical protein [Deltaproteobacteria bacterium]
MKTKDIIKLVTSKKAFDFPIKIEVLKRHSRCIYCGSERIELGRRIQIRCPDCLRVFSPRC